MKIHQCLESFPGVPSLIANPGSLGIVGIFQPGNLSINCRVSSKSKHRFATLHWMSNQVNVKATHCFFLHTLGVSWDLFSSVWCQCRYMCIYSNKGAIGTDYISDEFSFSKSLSNIFAQWRHVDVHEDIGEHSTTETSNAWRRMLQKARTRSTVKEVEKRCDTEMTVVIPQLDQPRSTRAEDMTDHHVHPLSMILSKSRLVHPCKLSGSFSWPFELLEPVEFRSAKTNLTDTCLYSKQFWTAFPSTLVWGPCKCAPCLQHPCHTSQGACFPQVSQTLGG